MNLLTRTVLLLALASPASIGAQTAPVDPAPGVLKSASFFPADTLLFVGNDYSREEMMQTSYGRFALGPTVRDFSKAYLSAMDQLLRQQGVPSDIETVTQWMDQHYDLIMRLQTAPLGYGLLALDPGEGGPPIVEFAVVVDALDDADEVAGMVGSLLEGVGAEPATVDGVDFQRIAVPEIPFPVHFGRLGSRLMLTIGAGAPSKIISCLRKERPTLDQSPRAEQARRKLVGTGRLSGLALIDFERFFNLALRWIAIEGEEIPTEARLLLSELGIDRWRTLSFGVGILGDTWQFGGFLGIEPGPDGFEPPLTVTDADLSLVPADTLFFWAGRCDLAKLYDRVLAILEAIDPEQRALVQRQIEAGGAMVGIEPRRLLAALGSSFVIYEEPGLRGVLPMPIVALRPADAEYLQSTARNLLNFAGAMMMRGNGPKLRLVDSEAHGSAITSIVIDAPEAVVAPSWSKVGDRLVFGLFPHCLREVAARAAAGDSSPITAASRYSRSRAALPSGATTVAYFDTPTLARLVYPNVAPIAQSLLGLAAQEGVDLPFTVADLPSPSELARHFTVEIGTTHRDADGFTFYSRAGFPLMSIAAPALAVAVPMSMVTVLGVQRRAEVAGDMARQARLRADGQVLRTASSLFHSKHGRSPQSIDELIDGGVVEGTREDLGDWYDNARCTGEDGQILCWAIMPASEGRIAIVVRLRGGVGTEHLEDVLREVE